jgi:hypothetical protein
MLYASYILFAIAFTGVYMIDPSYLKLLNTLIKYYVCIFLLIRFNPYVEDKSYSEEQKFDRKIVFLASFLLLLTTGITEYAQHILHFQV